MPKHVGNKLSAAAVNAAKKPGLYGDGHGLYLQISEYNTKAWVFRFMLEGRARKMGIGPLHTVTLAEARKRAAAARLKVLDRIDPVDAKRADRARKRIETAKAATFAQVAAQYIEAHRPGWRSITHAAQWNSTFNETRHGKRVYPALTAAINDLPVAAIDAPLVLKILEPIWTKTPETASRVRGRVESVLDFAKVRGFREGENPARWKGHLDHILPSRHKVASVEHHAALPYADVPAFVAGVSKRAGVAARALEFAVLTATRTSEALGARWSEIDLAKKLWAIPAERMKARKEHRVPLSDRAISILETLPRGGDLVFSSNRGDRLGEGSLRRLAKACGAQTVHGFRSAFRDWAAELTSHSSELAEMALAHAVGGAVERAYRRTDLMERRRRLMADWAAYCEQPPIERSGKVVSIRESA